MNFKNNQNFPQTIIIECRKDDALMCKKMISDITKESLKILIELKDEIAFEVYIESYGMLLEIQKIELLTNVYYNSIVKGTLKKINLLINMV